MPFNSHWDITKDMPDLTGKVVIVTGGNSGLGKEMVRQFALHNAKVYMASRTESKALGAIEDLKKDHPELADKPEITFLHLDLVGLESSMAAARTFLEKEERLDILVNNAGIMATPYELTGDGIEIQFQSNHLGHFAFTLQLLPTLIKTSKDPKLSIRIINVSSFGHTFIKFNAKFDSIDSINRKLGGPFLRYGQSKLANILFAKELSRRLSDERIFCMSVHPGAVRTELYRGIKGRYPFLKPVFNTISSTFYYTPHQGATTLLYVATSPEIEEKNWRGEYFVPFAKLGKPIKEGEDAQLARDLWDLSVQILKDKTGYSYPENES